MVKNDISELEQSFTYELEIMGVKLSQELRENGRNFVVNEANKESFATKLCLAKSLDEVELQIQSFKKGFFEIFPEDLVRIFTPSELGLLISGKSEIDVSDFKKYTRYNDYKSDHQVITWFWEIVEEMNQNMLANLLFFITGNTY